MDIYNTEFGREYKYHFLHKLLPVSQTALAQAGIALKTFSA